MYGVASTPRTVWPQAMGSGNLMGAYDDKMNLVLFESMKLDQPWTLQTYRSIGGYDVWEKYLKEKPTRESIIDAVKASGLRGRGGAAFPTGTK